MGMFNRGRKENKTGNKMSIADAIRGERTQNTEEIKAEITSALIETDAQKELYRTAAQRAIQKARRAIQNQNLAEKSIAYNELKFAYGVYHYMDTLHMAFRTIESQMMMQEMTQGFAKVVSRLKSIRVPAGTMDFNKLTAMALKGLDTVDMRGLDDMVNQLIHGTMEATNSTGASNDFLDSLVNGTATLETPFTELAPQEAPAAEAPAEEAPEQAEKTGEDELMALLDQINAGLKG